MLKSGRNLDLQIFVSGLTYVKHRIIIKLLRKPLASWSPLTGSPFSGGSEGCPPKGGDQKQHEQSPKGKFNSIHELDMKQQPLEPS